jgi:hypothetical protein
MRIMGKEQFIFPKPRSLIQSLLQQTTSDEDIIMDCFAGTGTTGHSVLSLNRDDGKKRRFILVEMDQTICRNITYERLKRVSQGYAYEQPKGGLKKVDGLGSGFSFCELGIPLFDAQGNIAKEVDYADLSTYVFFIETGVPLPKRSSKKSPLLGIHNDVAVYLLYNGILSDKTTDGGNVLTRGVLSELPAHNGTKVIYGTSCRISEGRLKNENIVFRQIPYELRID